MIHSLNGGFAVRNPCVQNYHNHSYLSQEPSTLSSQLLPVRLANTSDALFEAPITPSTNRSLILIFSGCNIAKIQLRKVAKIDRHLYVEGGEGGRASLCPTPTIQTSVEFGDIEELYLSWFSTNPTFRLCNFSNLKAFFPLIYLACPCRELKITCNSLS